MADLLTVNFSEDRTKRKHDRDNSDMSSKCARLTGDEEAPWKFYLYFFNARFPFLTVHRSLSSRLDLPVSLPSSICSKTSALKGNYELIHKQFDKRKAYYIWTYHSEVDGKRNPDVTPAARARHKHFMMIDPMNKPLKVSSPILDKNDFNLLTHDGSFVTILLQSSEEESVASGTSIKLVDGNYFVGRYCTEPELSRTRKFAQFLQLKLSKYNIVVNDQCPATHFCEFAAKVGLCVLKGKLSAVINIEDNEVEDNDDDEEDGETAEGQRQSEQDDMGHLLTASVNEQQSEEEEIETLSTFIAEYKKDEHLNIPQTLAGMLSMASSDAVRHIRANKIVNKVSSYGVSACRNNARVLLMTINLTTSNVTISQSEDVDITTAFNYVLKQIIE